MKKLIIIVSICMLFHTNNYAQQSTFSGRDKFYIAWQTGIPDNDFISKTSYVGGKIGYVHMVNTNLAVGLSTSWNSFEQYLPRTTYQKPDGTGAISTDIVEQLYSLPLTLDLNYYFKGGKRLLPYVGIGLGAQYSEQTIYFNIYSIEDETWGFVARPEIGVIFPFNRNNAMYLSGAYNYATNKSDFFHNDNLNHIAVSLGFVFSQ